VINTSKAPNCKFSPRPCWGAYSVLTDP